MIMGKGQDILKVTERLFEAIYTQSSIFSESNIVLNSQRGFLKSARIFMARDHTDHYGLRPKYS